MMKKKMKTKNLIMMHNIKNFLLCLKYPFLKVRNVWTGKFAGYSGTYLDWFPDGWRKAFGEQFCKDLKKALIKDNQLYKFRFCDIKEKYGWLRLSHFGAGKNTNYVLNRYEQLSKCYCIHCGKPVRYITDGWIEYLCEDCAKETIKPEYLDKYRLTKDDIPEITVYENGKEYRIDYNIDYETLWGLNEHE